MPEKKTVERAKKAKKEGKAPSTQAGEFVREEFEHIREGKHGARSTKQAIAIGLSKARRAGVALKPPAKGKALEKTRKSAESAYEKGQKKKPIDKKRSEAAKKTAVTRAKAAKKSAQTAKKASRTKARIAKKNSQTTKKAATK